VRAAVRMRAALVELNVRLEKKGKPVIKTGIGIHTGEVIAGNIGSEARMEYTVIGDAVNLAQRLESQARAGEVLVSRPVYDKVAGMVYAVPREPVKLKGKAQPVQLWEIKRVKAARTEAA
jgi:adenylate cyclase